MYAVAFVTLKYVQTLKVTGFEERQAEVLAETQVEIQEKNLSDLATKGDLSDLEARLESKMEKLELRMTIRLGALIVGSMGLLFTALRFFLSVH